MFLNKIWQSIKTAYRLYKMNCIKRELDIYNSIDPEIVQEILGQDYCYILKSGPNGRVYWERQTVEKENVRWKD